MMKTIAHRTNYYEIYLKRMFDIIFSLIVILLLLWLYVIVAFLIRIKLGSPVIFVQPRPGRGEKIFNMYKFRTMTDEKGDDGELLSDAERITAFGKKLRKTSLDEIPQVFNILKGDMSFIGPRPLLVRDMVFMTDEHRKRHCVRPGLSGLAQVNGRNAITWEKKLDYDLEYIKDVSFIKDMKIFIDTALCVAHSRDGVTAPNEETSDDLGDYLLNSGKITLQEYLDKQCEARRLLADFYA